jgi:hypothetical protein
MSIKLYIDQEVSLPDNDQWENRFTIKSESSERIYIIAQHRTKRHWACSCPGYKGYRHCKHLRALGLPTDQKPYEPDVVKR